MSRGWLFVPAAGDRWAILYTVITPQDEREFWLKSPAGDQLIYTLENLDGVFVRPEDAPNALIYAILTAREPVLTNNVLTGYNIFTDRVPSENIFAANPPLAIKSCPAPGQDPAQSSGNYMTISGFDGGTDGYCAVGNFATSILSFEVFDENNGSLGIFNNPQPEKLGKDRPYEVQLGASGEGWHIAIKHDTSLTTVAGEPDEFAVVAIASGLSDFLFTVHDNPAFISDSALNWKQPIAESYKTETDFTYSGSDACIEAYLASDDTQIVGATLYHLDLTQDIAGTPLKAYLESSATTTQVDVSTATLSSNGSCTATPGTPLQIDIQGPGRGSVEAIAFYPAQ